MAPEFQHVNAGDSPSVMWDADTYNAILDATRAHLGSLLGTTGTPALGFASLPSLLIHVENCTGGNLTANSPVRLDIESCTINLDFRKRPCYKAKAPTGNGTEVIAILAEPAVGYAVGNSSNGTGNGIVKACILGHTIANISISDTSHRFCDAAANNTLQLISSATGNIPILGNIPSTGNLTLGVLLAGRDTSGNGTTLHLGNVATAGNATTLGTGNSSTLLANGAFSYVGTPLTFSFNVANYTFPTGNTARLLYVQVGDACFPLTTQLANLSVPGFVGNVAQHWLGLKTLRNGFETGNGATGATTDWPAGDNIIRNTSGQDFLAVQSGISAASFGTSHFHGHYANNPTFSSSYGGSSNLPWISISSFSTVNGNGIHFGSLNTGGGYVELWGACNIVAINGVPGATGVLGVGACATNGWILNLGNASRPLSNGTVSSVNANSSIAGLGFTGGAITGAGTLTLNLTNAGDFRGAIDVYSTGEVYTKTEVDDLIAALQTQIDAINSKFAGGSSGSFDPTATTNVDVSEGLVTGWS